MYLQLFCQQIVGISADEKFFRTEIMRVDFYGCRNVGFLPLDPNLNFRENWHCCTPNKWLEKLLGLLWQNPVDEAILI